MRKSSLDNFKKFEINQEQKNDTKGGVFCEWYVLWANATGQSINEQVMGQAMVLDQTLATQGWWAAIVQGGRMFLNQYS